MLLGCFPWHADFPSSFVTELTRRRLTGARPKAPAHPRLSVQIGALDEPGQPPSFLGRHVRPTAEKPLVDREQVGPVLLEPLEPESLHLAAEMERDPGDVRRPGRRGELE